MNVFFASKLRTWALVLVAVAVIGSLDHITGHEVDVSVLYFPAVAVAAWYLSVGEAAAVALLCSLVEFVANYLAGLTYSSHIIAVWNVTIFCCVFLVVAFAVHKIRELTNRYQRIAAIIDCSDDAILSVKINGAIDSWNEGAERLFGYQAREIIGRPAAVLLPPGQAEEAMLYPSTKLDTLRLTKDGRQVNVSVVASAIRDPAGRLISVSHIVRDITARKRVEEALRRTMDELREADRKKDEYLAILAHELRNPMSTISAAASLLGQMELPAQAEKARAALQRQTKQLGRLVEDLLDLSRLSRGKITLEKENVDLRDLLGHAAEILEPDIRNSGHVLTLQLPEESLITDADPLRLQQIFTNLLSNAARYTDRGGEIAVVAQRAGDLAIITVKDTGIGVERDLQQKIFEPFFQIAPGIHRPRSGLGLGLTLVKSLTELHGGTVSVHSEGTGKGSMFTVSLPIEQVRSVAKAPRLLDVESGLNVLVVDDNRDTAILCASIFQNAGHDAVVAYDGESGLTLAIEKIFDVILLDIGLPGLDGYEVARRIRAASLDATLIVAVTGYGQERDRDMSREAGIDAHCLKPLQYEELVPILADWQHSERAKATQALRQKKSPENVSVNIGRPEIADYEI